MSIEFTCHCGARIRVSDDHAGKRGRCRECDSVINIPSENSHRNDSLIPLAPSRNEQANSDSYSSDSDSQSGDWLHDFANSESEAKGIATAPPVFSHELPEDTAEDIEHRKEAARNFSTDHGNNWIEDPDRTFLGDAFESFLLILNADNLATLAVLCIANFFITALSMFAGPFMIIGGFGVTWFLSAFYMNIVLETAAGEDELVMPGFTSFWEDGLQPFLRFCGTFWFVTIPVFLLKLVPTPVGIPLPWQAYAAMAAICIFFWPAVMLAVSIGGGFSGLWPTKVFKTVTAAPAAYVTIWAIIVGAFSLIILAIFAMDQAIATGLMPQPSARGAIVITFGMLCLGQYAMVITMRAIGLYYRHFKHRLPWRAE